MKKSVRVQLWIRCNESASADQYSEQDYRHAFIQLNRASRQFGIKIVKNVPPKHYRKCTSGGSQPNQFLDLQSNEIVEFPVAESFQIYYKNILVFSKLQTGTFPKTRILIFVLKSLIKLCQNDPEIALYFTNQILRNHKKKSVVKFQNIYTLVTKQTSFTENVEQIGQKTIEMATRYTLKQMIKSKAVHPYSIFESEQKHFYLNQIYAESNIKQNKIKQTARSIDNFRLASSRDRKQNVQNINFSIKSKIQRSCKVKTQRIRSSHFSSKNKRKNYIFELVLKQIPTKQLDNIKCKQLLNSQSFHKKKFFGQENKIENKSSFNKKIKTVPFNNIYISNIRSFVPCLTEKSHNNCISNNQKNTQNQNVSITDRIFNIDENSINILKSLESMSSKSQFSLVKSKKQSVDEIFDMKNSKTQILKIEKNQSQQNLLTELLQDMKISQQLDKPATIKRKKSLFSVQKNDFDEIKLLNQQQQASIKRLSQKRNSLKPSHFFQQNYINQRISQLSQEPSQSIQAEQQSQQISIQEKATVQKRINQRKRSVLYGRCHRLSQFGFITLDSRKQNFSQFIGESQNAIKDRQSNTVFKQQWDDFTNSWVNIAEPAEITKKNSELQNLQSQSDHNEIILNLDCKQIQYQKDQKPILGKQKRTTIQKIV